MRQENECAVDEWKLIPFTSNIEMLSGFPFDSNYFNDFEGKPLIRIRNIISGKTETFFNGEYSNEYLIKKGDILVGMDGDFHIKKWQGSEALLNQRILKLYESETSQINLNFFYYLSQPFLLKVHKRTAGTTVKHLSTKDFKNASFKIPPYKEQQKIADILSTVDAKIEVIDQQITETQELKKGLMQRLLTKGISHTEFKDSALGEIPKSWEIVKLKDVTKNIKDGTHATHKEEVGGIPLLSAKDIRNGKISIPDDCRKISQNDFDTIHKNFKLMDGDVLLTVVGSIGRVAIIQGYQNNYTFQRSVGYIRFDKLHNPYFFKQFFQSGYFTKQLSLRSNASAQAGIYLGELGKINVPSIPYDEQLKIAKILTSVDDKLEVLSEKKTTYQELKKGLMQQLLTGKVRVRV